RSYRETSEGMTTSAKVTHTNAYIVNGTLVMQLISSDFELTMEQRYVPIKLSTGFIVAEMNEDFSQVVDGTLAGRFPVDDMKEAGPPLGVCEGNFANLDESFADLLATERRPGEPPNPGGPCDAISVGIGFRGTAVSWGGIAPTRWDPPEWCDS